MRTSRAKRRDSHTVTGKHRLWTDHIRKPIGIFDIIRMQKKFSSRLPTMSILNALPLSDSAIHNARARFVCNVCSVNGFSFKSPMTTETRTTDSPYAPCVYGHNIVDGAVTCLIVDLARRYENQRRREVLRSRFFREASKTIFHEVKIFSRQVFGWFDIFFCCACN